MSEFKTIETQEELDTIIKERIRRERDKYSDYESTKTRLTQLEQENSELKSVLEANKQSLTDKDTELGQLQSVVTGYETAALRTKIALQSGLPYDLADRLVGTDEESLKRDAERLAGFIRPSQVQAPIYDKTPDRADDGTTSMKQMLRELTAHKGE